MSGPNFLYKCEKGQQHLGAPPLPTGGDSIQWWPSADKVRLQAYASGVAGSSPHTSATGSLVATLAWSWSTGASTRPTWRMNQMSWRAKTRPCGLSWCAGTSASTVACWRATESSRGFPQTSPTASTGRAAAATPPRRHRIPTRHGRTATTAAAAALASTRVAAPPRPMSEQRQRSHGHDPRAISLGPEGAGGRRTRGNDREMNCYFPR